MLFLLMLWDAFSLFSTWIRKQNWSHCQSQNCGLEVDEKQERQPELDYSMICTVGTFGQNCYLWMITLTFSDVRVSDLFYVADFIIWGWCVYFLSFNNRLNNSALMLLVGWQEGHPACKNWVVGCWRGYLSEARCRLAYGPADATATHCLLLQ